MISLLLSVCLSLSSLKDCGITDVSALTQSLSKTQALQFLKELDLTNNKMTNKNSGEELNDVIQGSNCKLRWVHV